MPLGHLVLGLLGGTVALTVALAAGLPLWMAGLAFLGIGNLGLMVSVALQLWIDHARRPPPHGARARRKAPKLRPLRAPH